MSPRSQKISAQMREESRSQIVKAARHLFATQGYFTCKVSDIAREAGMSQGNVYWYFKSKEEVLKAVLAEGFEAVEQMIAEAVEHPGAAVEKIEHLVERSIALYQEQGEFYTLLLTLVGHGGQSFIQELGFDMPQIGAGYHQRLSPIFAQGQVEGAVAALDPNILVMFYFSFFNGLMLTYNGVWQTFPPEWIRDAVLRLVGRTQ